MPRRRSGLGNDLAERLLARSNSGLHRRGMADGGEVYTGALVDRAMKALGGRMNAFTMNHRVFMPSTFDPTSPQDQATYAHEQVHAQDSGGAGGRRFGSNPDAEESRARAVEQMVLHQAEGTGAGALPSSPTGAPPTPGSAQAPTTDAQDVVRGYQALIAEGLSHQQIVDQLKRHVVDTLGDRRDDRRYRGAPHELP